MKLIRPTSTLMGVLLVFGFSASWGRRVDASDPIYLDASQPLERRVDDLVARMTLSEKVSQMMNTAPAVTRLGIPAYDWWSECLHGVARYGIATVFPQAIGMAATWDTDLIREAADVISTEARAKHHDAVRRGERVINAGLTMWSPNINIFRDPRWGRGQETYGEDPYLAARLGVAFVRGLQGDDPRYLKIVSTPKHYAVHSGPEPLRHSFDANANERDLRETYLPAFEATVREAGAFSVMCAYNRYEGAPACASDRLLDDVLRKEWGFPGYVVSDCGAIRDIWANHKFAKTAGEASALAVKTGCDLECGTEYRSLVQAVSDGLIDERQIDVAVKRLFTARFKLGMFDPPEKVKYAQIPITANDTPEHRALALKVAQESIVLLKNQNNVLPLAKRLKTVAVIGNNAHSVPVLLGNYNGTPSRAVTALDGIRNKLPQAEVLYAKGADLLDVTPSVIPSAWLRPAGAAGDQTGLTAEYWDNPTFAGEPKHRRIDAQVDFAWDRLSPAPGVAPGEFSVRWTGTLIPAAGGALKVGATSDGLARLWIDGRLLIDDSKPHRLRTRFHSVELVAGRSYELKLEYSHRIGRATARLVWVEPVTDEERLAEAVRIAGQAEVVILVLGLSPEVEGEEMEVLSKGYEGGDRLDIGLPKRQERLLRAVHATGKPIVLVLMSGSALAVNWAVENVPAIIQAWYGGEEAGTALADVLFGDVSPAGRLPITFYKSADQLPPFEDYAMAGRTYRYFEGAPEFPFGHGLSYTQFRYSDLEVACSGGKRSTARGTATPDVGDPAKSAGTFHVGETLTITALVENVGPREGDEVVQLYVRDTAASVPVPIRSLTGFKRIHLKPGEKLPVSFTLTPRQLSVITDDGRRIVEPGVFQIWVGGKQPGFTGVSDTATSGIVSAHVELR
jgi:beta-glucosidase